MAQGAKLFGGIEGGGSKFECAVGTSHASILASTTIPTGDPGETLANCVRFLAGAAARHGPLAALGVACFGPLELRPAAPDYGRMLATPKPGWSGADLLAPLREAFRVPVAIDTDVGAASRAEWRYGAGRGLESLAYVTVGTGIGGAIAPAEPPMQRMMHAEMGHLPVRRDARDRAFPGCCPFHGDCLEGLASGPAIRARWGCMLDALPAGHEGRAVIGGYLGQLAAAIALMAAPHRVVFGGGVMADGSMLPLVRDAAYRYLNGYLAALQSEAAMASFIVAPVLGARAGIAGALLLAEQALAVPGASGPGS